MITETRIMTHEFSQEELEELGKYLSETVQAHSELEFEKKEATKSYNNELKKKMAVIKSTAKKINDGNEDRQVDCEVEMNTPIYGQKTITRLDTRQCWIEDMKPEEFDLFNQETAMDGLTKVLGEEIEAFKGTKASISFHATTNNEPWDEEE